MLSLVPSELDKREGSLIYTAVAPICAHLAKAYIEMDANIDLVFADTACGEYLDRICNQLGVYRKGATFAKRKGVFKDSDGELMDIQIGARFGCGEVIFEATQKIKTGEFSLVCESAGSIGNGVFSDVLPIDYIENLGSVEITDILTAGEDQDSDDQLRKKVLERINSSAFCGNVADYKAKVKEIESVGAVRVVANYDGPGSVKIVILGSDFGVASGELVDKVQKKIYPDDINEIGIAPIGHRVVVTTCQEAPIDVKLSLVLQDTADQQLLQEHIENAINAYFYQLKQNWDSQNEPIVVRLSQIENRVLDVDGVIDVSMTYINENDRNFVLSDFEIPKLRNVQITVE